ncbi:MAG: NADP-dependent malic enzyme [Saprospiraceae bacterium]|nr:NADP-dependent malic enzyme [Saprospiraceae bacterium]
MDIYEESMMLHKQLRGKIRVNPKIDLHDQHELALVYSPGVAAPCKAIEANPQLAYDYTIKGNTIAIVTDGSAVLGLGNIGALASIPVMEGKAMLFKRFAALDAFPICLDTQDPDEIIATVRRIAPVFGGINLEDIAAPQSFYIEEQLQDLGIPVFHDDQHGTAIVTLAGLINAAKLVNKPFSELKVVINGAGAAGIAIARMLKCVDDYAGEICTPVKELLICDTKGIIHPERDDINESKRETLKWSNIQRHTGTVRDAIRNADVFIGVSVGDLLNREDIRTMATDPVIFALANPTPEIMPDEAYAGGAAVVATGRSDLPNQVNNALGFPGIFRGAVDARATRITPRMKLAAAYAIAEFVREPSREMIIPPTLNEEVAWKVAKAVKQAAIESH